MKRSSKRLQFAKPFSQFQLTSGTNLSKRCILFIILLLMSTAGFGQAPNISYHTPNVFEADTVITPLTPTNTGGNVPNPATIQVVAKAKIPKSDNTTTYNMSFTVDAVGNIYYCNYVGQNVLKFPAGGGSAIPLGSGIGFPAGVAVDAAGNVYVSDVFVGKVWEIPVGGGPMILVGTGISGPEGLALDATGNIYVATLSTNAIVKLTPGNTTPVIVASAPTAYGVALDASGNIYFVNGENLYEIPAGSGHASLFTRRPVTVARSIAIDAAGNIYLAEGDGNPGTTDHSEGYLITKIPADGSAAVREGTAPLSYNCTEVAVTPSGSIFTNDLSAGGVYQITQGNYSLASSLPQGLFLNANSGNISGMPIYATPAADYVINTHNDAGSSSATVNIKIVSKNALLSKLLISDGNSRIPPDTGHVVQFNVLYGQTSIAIIPFAVDSSATIKINGGPTLRSGSRSAPYPLALGQNVFTIVVTAPDGITTRTYNVQILRLQSSNNYLTHLTLSRGVLSPAFTTFNDRYSTEVNGTIASVTVTPVTTDTTARITVNGTALPFGTTSAAIPLNVGPNTITIVVTAQNGSINTYTIAVTRAPEPNTFLATLAISRGIFSPKFSHLITTYTVGVGPSVTSVTLTPTALNPNSTITVNGIAVLSGATSQPIPLVVYNNVVSIVITAPDGLKRTYTVFVERAASPDATLSNLFISQGTLTPAFAATTSAYTAAVDNTITSITVTPTANDSTASIQVGRTTVPSGTASPPINLAVGDNTIHVTVTAQNFYFSQNYTIIVNRPASTKAQLLTLNTDQGDFTPPFDKSVYSYTKAVANTVTSIKFTPTTIDNTATVTINGTAVASGTQSGALPLNVGDNTITTIVTAPQGLTTLTNTYTVTVTRASGGANTVYEPVSIARPLETTQLAADEVNVHEGISPNGDGVNDFLVIENIANYPDNKLQILNRSGQLIFEAKNYDNSTNVFDGHSNKTGAKQLPGTYFYSLDYTVKGVAKHKTGFIVLKY